MLRLYVDPQTLEFWPSADAVVATDTASADADCDNGVGVSCCDV